MMKNFNLPAWCCGALFFVWAAPAMANEPQHTTAAYDDWVMQCNLRLPAPPPQTAGSDGEAKLSEGAKTDAPKPAAPAIPALPSKPERFCEIVQTFAVRGAPIARLAISRTNGSDDGVAVFQSPVGAHIPDGVSIKVDDAQEFKGVFVWCNPEGCLADAAIPKAGLEKIKTAQKIAVSFTFGPNATVTLPVSGKGLVAAFDAAVAAQAKPIEGVAK